MNVTYISEFYRPENVEKKYVIKISNDDRFKVLDVNGAGTVLREYITSYDKVPSYIADEAMMTMQRVIWKLEK